MSTQAMDNNFNDMLNDVYTELESITSNSTKLIIPNPIIEILFGCF